MSDTPSYGLHRREFLLTSAAATLGLAGAAAAESAPAEPPRVRAYRTLGRTELKISDISFGSSRLSSGTELVREALDLGINYFDTAESYRRGASEETLGKALGADRARVFLASKVQCETDSTVQQLMEALEGSLRRLRTDHVDVYFNHAVNDVKRLQNPAWGEFVERAKQQGKIRYRGMSGHGGRLHECLEHALEHDLVDVILVAYNFGQDPSFYERFTASLDFVAIQPELPKLIARAKAKGVGVIAMKTLMGGRLNDLRAYETKDGTFAQAAFRWVLSNPDVDALVVSITESAELREFVSASGQSAVRTSDLELLGRYVARNGAQFCQIGCGACLPACPENVPINDVLRARMYALDYGDRALGRAEYAALGEPASACVGCAHRACLGACPNGLDIAALTGAAHALLGARA
jgi:predicted aldo/keto reductase-like oxidoreductase